MNHVEIEARRLIDQWGSNDPFELCDYLGIYVIDCDLPENISGFYHCMCGVKIIYLNLLLNTIRRKVVCAHELGHAVLHDQVNALFMQNSSNILMSKYEKEADLFCAELLIDDEALHESRDIEALARQTGIPERILKLKYNKM